MNLTPFVSLVGVVGKDAVVHFRDGGEMGGAVAVDDDGDHFVVGWLGIGLGLGGIIWMVVGNCQTSGFSPGSKLPGLWFFVVDEILVVIITIASRELY